MSLTYYVNLARQRLKHDLAGPSEYLSVLASLPVITGDLKLSRMPRCCEGKAKDNLGMLEEQCANRSFPSSPSTRGCILIEYLHTCSTCLSTYSTCLYLWITWLLKTVQVLVLALGGEIPGLTPAYEQPLFFYSNFLLFASISLLGGP